MTYRKPGAVIVASPAGQRRKIEAISSLPNRQPCVQADPVRAELLGSDTCRAESYTARGHVPVLAICRTLIAAGVDPERPLHAYRGATLCLIVPGIGAGGALTVKSSGNGSPIFAPLRGATAPPIAPMTEPTVRVHKSALSASAGP